MGSADESVPILAGRVALLESQMTEARWQRTDEEKLIKRFESLELRLSELKSATEKLSSSDNNNGHEESGESSSRSRQEERRESCATLSPSNSDSFQLDLADIARVANDATLGVAAAVADLQLLKEQLPAQQAVSAELSKFASTVDRFDVTCLQSTARLAEHERETQSAINRWSNEVVQLSVETRDHFEYIDRQLLEAHCMCKDHKDRLGSLELMCLQLEKARAECPDSSDFSPEDRPRLSDDGRRQCHLQGGREDGRGGGGGSDHLRANLVACLKDGRLAEAVRMLEEQSSYPAGSDALRESLLGCLRDGRLEAAVTLLFQSEGSFVQ